MKVPLEQSSSSEPNLKVGAVTALTESFTGKPLGYIVKALYGVSDETIEEALQIQEETGERLGDILIDEGVISGEQLTACLAVLAKKETTFLSHAFWLPLREHWWARHLQLTLESFVVTLLTLLIVSFSLGLEQSGLISLFLASAALNTRFNVVLMEQDVRNESLNILALFIGVLLAFVGVGGVADLPTLEAEFAFVLNIANINPSSTLSQRNFGTFDSIVVHNAVVLLSIFLLTFIYRGYAVLLTLSWNACVWGLTLTILFKQSFEGGESASAYVFILGVVGLLPHLILEAVAYIIGAISAIGISKSLLWYEATSKRFQIFFRRYVLLLVAAFGVLVLAGLAESFWASRILELIR
tara:strand:- start:747 stop:1814 length:1068 start_codon:yes stop_codon:yes gene_type:complete